MQWERGPRAPGIPREAAEPEQAPPCSAWFSPAPPLPLAAEPMGKLHTAECDGAGVTAELRVGESGGKFVLGRRRRFCGSG